MTKEVFVAVFEVRRLADSELIPAGTVGGFVRCYVLASNQAEAVERITSELESERCAIVSVEWCMRRSELEPDADAESGDECARLAGENEDIVIGRVDLWDDDETS